MLTTIPFSGLYESIHDQALDFSVEQLFADENGDPNEELSMEVHDACCWQDVFNAYAKEYCEQFAHAFDVKLEFESLNSPREYNFTTDRIFATISEEEVRRLYSAVDWAILDRLAIERFTSRSGFISSYSPCVRDWGDVGEWDHNQLGTLLQAWAEQETQGEWSVSDEEDLMESPRCNGMLEEWICSATPGIDALFEKGGLT